MLTDDRHMAPDMAIATELVRSKRLLVAVGELPGVVG
jgi:histidine ammonia-lyase